MQGRHRLIRKADGELRLPLRDQEDWASNWRSATLQGPKAPRTLPLLTRRWQIGHHDHIGAAGRQHHHMINDEGAN